MKPRSVGYFQRWAAMRRLTISSLSATFTVLTLWVAWDPAVAQPRHQPRTLAYDPTRTADYATADLIDLLSDGSLQRNARPTRGIYNVLPPDERRLESPPGADPRLFVRLELDTHALDYTRSVEAELVTRRPLDELLGVFAGTPDWVQQAWIIDVLARIRDPRADSALRNFATGSRDRMAYFALKYFALACDTRALATLNTNYSGYPVPSIEWAAIVRSFGECQYSPATQNLVDSLTAMMLDVGYAAHRSLLQLYPDATVEFRDPRRAQSDWKAYLAKPR